MKPYRAASDSVTSGSPDKRGNNSLASGRRYFYPAEALFHIVASGAVSLALGGAARIDIVEKFYTGHVAIASELTPEIGLQHFCSSTEASQKYGVLRSPLACFQSSEQLLPNTPTPHLPPEPASWQNPQLLGTIKGHPGSVESLAFSPNGQLLAIGGGRNTPTIELWNIQKGKRIYTLKGHQTRVLVMAVTPDGKTLASGSDDALLNLWNLETGKLIRTFQEHTSHILSLAVTPDGQTLVSGALDGIKLWDLSQGRFIHTLERFDQIYSVAISPDGRLLASGSKNKTIKLWNLETQCRETANCASVGIFKGHTEAVSALAFTPDGRTLVSGSYDKTLKVWNIETRQLLYTLSNHTTPIKAVAIAPDGQTLASASRDGLRIWDLRTGELLDSLSEDSGWVQAIAFSPDGQKLASGGINSMIKIWQGVSSPRSVVSQ